VPRASTSHRRILDGARRAIDRYGWQHATAERIAEEAGVSRVTLHRHGLTRETILARLGEEAAERYREAMWPALTAPEPAGERLARALEILCELAEENLGLLLALDAQANAAVFHDDREAEALTRDVFTEPLERLLRDGYAEGSVNELGDPLETATTLFNLVGWTYVHLRSGHRWRPERARRATLELVLTGLRTR
jgi:AcrR family transcriptional regulator